MVATRSQKTYEYRSPSRKRRRPSQDSMSAPPTSAMLGAIKGQGLSFLKNMKDKTTAVVQTVQSTYGKGPELYPITTRFLFTVQPVVPDALAAQAEEALRNHLNETVKKYMVVNLNPRKLRSEAFRHPPINTPFMPLSSGVPPTLNQLLDLCLQILNFLRQDNESTIVVHGVQEHVFLVSAAVLLFFRLVTRPTQCFEMISGICALSPQLPPSYHRALDLVALVSGPDRQTLRKQITSRTIILKSLAIEPIPLFNTAVTGCRPFVEIYVGGIKVWSMPGEFNSHRSFELPTDTSIEIPIDSVVAFDDVTVVVQHVSYSQLQGKTNLVTMMSFGFHSSFSSEQNNLLVFRHGDLDAPNGKIAENTKIILGLSCDPVDRGFADESELPYFLKIDMNGVRPTFLTSTSAEYDKYAHKYMGQGISAVSAPPTICTAKSNNSESVAPKRDDFFGSLSWDATAQKPSTRNVDLLQDQGSNSQRDVAEQSERLAGIRVGQVEKDHDADQYKFDYEKNETPIMGQNSPVTSQQMPAVLGLGEPVVPEQTNVSNYCNRPIKEEDSSDCEIIYESQHISEQTKKRKIMQQTQRAQRKWEEMRNSNIIRNEVELMARARLAELVKESFVTIEIKYLARRGQMPKAAFVEGSWDGFKDQVPLLPITGCTSSSFISLVAKIMAPAGSFLRYYYLIDGVRVYRKTAQNEVYKGRFVNTLRC